jgi:hypothetical protein
MACCFPPSSASMIPAALSSAACSCPLIVCYFLIANGVVLGDIDLAEYNVWHSYVFLFIGHFVLFGVLNERSEKAAYQELREEILAEIRARGFDLFAVISAIEEGTGGEMKQVAAMLKKEEQA